MSAAPLSTRRRRRLPAQPLSLSEIFQLEKYRKVHKIDEDGCTDLQKSSAVSNSLAAQRWDDAHAPDNDGTNIPTRLYTDENPATTIKGENCNLSLPEYMNYISMLTHLYHPYMLQYLVFSACCCFDG